MVTLPGLPPAVQGGLGCSEQLLPLNLLDVWCQGQTPPSRHRSREGAKDAERELRMMHCAPWLHRCKGTSPERLS